MKRTKYLYRNHQTKFVVSVYSHEGQLYVADTDQLLSIPMSLGAIGFGEIIFTISVTAFTEEDGAIDVEVRALSADLDCLDQTAAIPIPADVANRLWNDVGEDVARQTGDMIAYGRSL